MAHHQATKKSIRKTSRQTVVNGNRRNRIRTFIKKVDAAIEEGKKAPAQEALKNAQSELMKGVTKGIFKLNTASRKISRLSAKVKALKA